MVVVEGTERERGRRGWWWWWWRTGSSSTGRGARHGAEQQMLLPLSLTLPRLDLGEKERWAEHNNGFGASTLNAAC